MASNVRTSNVRTSIRVEGVVQGVGFRPFVYSLATRLGLAGWVGNDVDGVFAEVEGPAEQIRDFLAALERDAPPLARVERVSAQPMSPDGRPGFAIVASDTAGARRALVSADSATCADCLRELADPADRRFGYPFINCTNCGPRFTIVRDVPYDRPLTTMAGFTMCAACAAEYHDPANRRFHAQPVCCPACGPRLRLLAADGTELSGPDGRRRRRALAGAVAALAAGQVLAVKGLGGYHLAVDAASDQAAALLRSRKHREDKPFAVMAADLAAARALCEVDDLAASLLTSPRRPIVLLPRRDGAGPGPACPLAAAVAPGNRQLGVMLPYTPLHHLLLRDFGRPMVLTSGNVSDEPIAYRDEDALARLGGLADVFLTHDRPIHIRTDDSVVRPFRGRETVLRRSRGYVPEPLAVASRFARPVLACGAELKNTFCLGRGDRAFLSHHVGDLENYETLRSFTDGIGHFRRLFDVDAPDHRPRPAPGVPVHQVRAGAGRLRARRGPAPPRAHRLVPGRQRRGRAGHRGRLRRHRLRHGRHHLGRRVPAGRPGRRGAGRAPGRGADARRRGRDPPAVADGRRLPGRRLPRRPARGLDVAARNSDTWPDVLTLARRGVNAPLTSSAGRLFDAVAALLGIRDSINYEGQAAVELEQLTATSRHDPYPAAITDGQPLTVAGSDLVRAAAQDLLDGVPREVIGARFHQGVAAMIGEACGLLRERSGLGTVALSGGVFQNLLLLGTVVDLLEGRGFRVLTHSRVPPNDGGISLGQAVVAAARDRAGRLA